MMVSSASVEESKKTDENSDPMRSFFFEKISFFSSFRSIHLAFPSTAGMVDLPA